MRECENARELNTIVSQLVRPKVALINYENRIVITFNGSPMEAVSYVSVVLDACEWSPSPLILWSNWSFVSSFSICLLSPSSFIVASFTALTGDCFNETNDSLVLIVVGSVMLSTSSIVEIEEAAAIETGSILLINGASTIDLRPDIGSNRSSIESRGFLSPELQPLDNRKSKSFEFNITVKDKTQIKIDYFFHVKMFGFFYDFNQLIHSH